MKKIVVTLLLFIGLIGYSQTNGITYQAVILNPSGEQLPGVNNTNAPLANKYICLKFSIIDQNSQSEYIETVQTTTDEFGMVNLVIGTGVQIGGYVSSFANILWNANPKRLKVDLSTTGVCSYYTEISNQPFTAVPFAMFAASAGTPGTPGPAGPQGIQGVAGPTGATGLTGAVGPQGLQGIQGAQGLAGTNGTNGLDGAVGPQGLPGIQGAVGPQGLQGLQGLAGTNGINGINGLDGAVGPQGPIGLTGPTGSQGISGIQGDAGPIGATGPAGAVGPQGIAGTNGTNGINGLDGAVGPQGPQGLTGLTGLQGLAGIQGDAGPIGASGPAGAVGPQGLAGTNGINGINGLDGAVGPQGPIGLTGPTGSQGIAGIQGVAGATGATGADGPQGPAGTNGSNASVTIGAISSSSNTNGASITAGELKLAPADATNGGIVNTGNQTFSGSKTFNSNVIGNLSGNATSATNIAGGSLGQIPYQNNINTTSFLPADTSTSRKFLSSVGSNGIATAPSWQPISPSDIISSSTLVSGNLNFETSTFGSQSWTELGTQWNITDGWANLRDYNGTAYQGSYSIMALDSQDCTLQSSKDFNLISLYMKGDMSTATSIEFKGYNAAGVLVGSVIVNASAFNFNFSNVNLNFSGIRKLVFHPIGFDPNAMGGGSFFLDYFSVTFATSNNLSSVNGILKSNGNGEITAAVSGTDFLAPTGSAAGLTNFPTLNQNTTGTAANVSGIVAIANGGTSATTAAEALTNLGAAPIDSPNLAGTPTAPTAAPGTNTTQIATTAFVTNAVSTATTGAFVDLISEQTVAGDKNFTGNIGIGTTTPESSAALDVTSTSQGFLPPRMTQNQRNAIVNKVAGLIIWCKNCGENGELQVYNGTAWTNFIGGAPSEPLVVGSAYRGGKIAYIFQSGDPGYVAGEFHGIIASNSDLSNGIRWGQGFNGLSTTYDCVNRHGSSGYALPCAIGAGSANTALIITSTTESNPADYAALICSNYSVVTNGVTYSDWFLPSKDEMAKLYQNKSLIGGLYYDSANPSSKSNWYWTSSGDVFQDRATDVSSDNGNNGRNFRGQLLSVRAVMYF